MKVRVKKKDFLKACTDINLTVRKGEPTELHQWKLGSLLAKEFVEVEAEPIEAVKTKHHWHDGTLFTNYMRWCDQCGTLEADPSKAPKECKKPIEEVKKDKFYGPFGTRPIWEMAFENAEKVAINNHKDVNQPDPEKDPSAWSEFHFPKEKVRKFKAVKCERLHDFEISMTSPYSQFTYKLNQEFDNIYAILEGMKND